MIDGPARVKRAHMLVLVFAALGVAAFVELLRGPTRKRRIVAAAGLAFALGGAGLAAGLGGFEARKVAGHLAMPAGLVWLALLALSLADLRARRARRAAASFGIFFAFTLAGSVPLGHALVAGLESEIPPPPRAAHYDAVFVLGGGVGRGPDGSPELLAAGDRARLGAALFHEGRTERLVASGFSPPPFGLGDLAALTRELWIELGIPAGAILELSEPTNTKSEIAAYAELARREGWTTTALVSSAWHLPRAMALARAADFDPVPLGADHLAATPLRPSALWLVPQRWGFGLLHTWAWERLGRAVGR